MKARRSRPCASRSRTAVAVTSTTIAPPHIVAAADHASVDDRQLPIGRKENAGQQGLERQRLFLGARPRAGCNGWAGGLRLSNHHRLLTNHRRFRTNRRRRRQSPAAQSARLPAAPDEPEAAPPPRVVRVLASSPIGAGSRVVGHRIRGLIGVSRSLSIGVGSCLIGAGSCLHAGSGAIDCGSCDGRWWRRGGHRRLVRNRRR